MLESYNLPGTFGGDMNDILAYLLIPPAVVGALIWALYKIGLMSPEFWLGLLAS